MTTRSGTAFTIVVGVVASGALIWAATRVDGTATWRYWATLGVLAAAGLVFALSQRASYGAWAVGAVTAFLLAFIPAAIASGWIAIAGMPHGNWLRNHILSWSGDIGIRHLVVDLTRYVSVMAFAVGSLLASVPALVARSRRTEAPADGEPGFTPPARPATTDRRPVDERLGRRDRVEV